MDSLIQVDESMLPVLGLPKDELIPELAFAWHVLEYCRLLPQEVPLSFANLGIKGGNLMDLLGAPVCAKFYPGARPTDDAVIPRPM